ncbi:MAG TPA: hypothetical protein IAD43_01715 [Candidatus Scatomorpha pullicola]|nr:hypothetical protein [Candidatus Scatomorpha pullicola]
MKLKKTPAILVLTAAIVFVFLSACGARSAIMASLPDEAAKQKAAELMTASPSDEVTEDDIAEDLMLFRSVGTSVDNFVSFSVEDGRIIYCKELAPGLENSLAIEQNSDGDVIVDYWEGELHNQVTYKSNGDVLLDGNEVSTSYE